jgi:hypothetical protein
MTDLVTAIAQTRSAVAAVMRIVTKASGKPGKQPTQFRIAMVGTAWCVAGGRHFLTAHHVLNGGKARDPKDKFCLFLVPGNGNPAYRFSVVDFPLEDAASDLAIISIDPGAQPGARASNLKVTFDEVPDGAAVVTCGFPAPIIVKGSVDQTGNWMGGQFFLKSHANTGIVSAHYTPDHGRLSYELSVGWHHGESGGPICRLEDGAVFSVMQSYRNIQSPNGVLAGPHQGVSLRTVRAKLEQLGAEVVSSSSSTEAA